MSGSDVSRDNEDFDEGQFSDADDEAVEVRRLQIQNIVAGYLQGSHLSECASNLGAKM